MIDRLFEFMLIQTLAVSVWEDTGELTMDEYILIISTVAREIENRTDNLDLLPAFMEEKQLLTAEGMLAMLVF